MFTRSNTDRRRVIIVDFAHMAYSVAYGATSLSAMVNIGGTNTTIDTTIPALTIKRLNKWADSGNNPMAVCFDGRGSCRCRKVYFAGAFGMENDKNIAYKGKRDLTDHRLYEGIELTTNLLLKAGIACFRAEGYEADDLIKACVDKAKVTYPNLPIDIITGDQDLLPLVDEQVSVFIRSPKMTYAVEKSIEKLHYVQVTPDNFESYVGGLSTYKNVPMPYNSILLYKLLRGDKSDEIPGKKDWKPKIYTKLVEMLQAREVDLGKILRYDAPIEIYIDKRTNTQISADMLNQVPKEEIGVMYGEPPALTKLCEILQYLVEVEDIEHIKRVYNGINLNGAFMDNPDGYRRVPAKIATDIKGYNPIDLQMTINPLKINLNL